MATGIGPNGALAGGGALPNAGALGSFGGSAAAPTAAAPAAFDPTMAAGSSPGEITAGTPGAAPDTVTGGSSAPVASSSSFLDKLKVYTGLATLGGTVATALINRNATNTARDQLVTANTKAQADLKALYGNTADTLGGIAQRQQQNLSPYVSLGGGAAGLLGQGLGINVPAPTTTLFQPRNPFTSGPPNGQLPNGPASSGGFQGPSNVTLAPSFQPGISSPYQSVGGNLAIPAGAPAGGGAVPTGNVATGSVRMQAPTGEIAMVPAAQVAAAQAKGAKLVTAGA